MDLYPENRKLAGAATRTFAAMAKITSDFALQNWTLHVRPSVFLSNRKGKWMQMVKFGIHFAKVGHMMQIFCVGVGTGEEKADGVFWFAFPRQTFARHHFW